MIKKFVTNNKKFFLQKKLYSTLPFEGKYSQAKNLSENAKKLLAKGADLDVKFKGTTLLEKIITDEVKDSELDAVNFKDPEILKRWISDAASKGLDFQCISSSTVEPVVVTVTGACGSIGYSLLPRICAGDMLGPDQPIILKLVEIDNPKVLKALEGVVMELHDCAFPLLKKIVATSDLKEGFTDSDYCLLVGSKPRSKGMERGDLLKENAKAFAQQGRAINHYAKSSVLTLVVGNPANTNCLVAAKNAPNLSPNQFSAMTRLDHDRGLAQIANKVGCNVNEIERFCIWGNHSSTQYPDLSHTLIKGKWFRDVINHDEAWIEKEFIPNVQQRGAAIINAMGKSSAASAAGAAIAHMRDWVIGASGWQSMAIYSTGQNGVTQDIYSSFPVICRGAGKADVVSHIPFSEESARRINLSVEELIQEKEAVKHLFPPIVKRFSEVPADKVYSWKWISNIVPKQHIDMIMSDKEYLNATKVEIMKYTPLGKPIKDNELPWKNFDWAALKAKKSEIDLSGLKALQEKRNLSEDDIELFTDASLKSLENDADLLERKYKKVFFDIEDLTLSQSKYFELSKEEQVKYHFKRICEDGKLTSEGINTQQIAKNMVNYLVNAKIKHVWEDCWDPVPEEKTEEKQVEAN